MEKRKIVTFTLKYKEGNFTISFDTKDKDLIIQMFYKMKSRFYELILDNISATYRCELEYMDDCFDIDSYKTFVINEDDISYINSFKNLLNEIKDFVKL